jgi:hypothetical protein
MRARRLVVAAFGSSRMRNATATASSNRNVGAKKMPTAGILLNVTAAQTANTMNPIQLEMRERRRETLLIPGTTSKAYSPTFADENRGNWALSQDLSSRGQTVVWS